MGGESTSPEQLTTLASLFRPTDGPNHPPSAYRRPSPTSASTATTATASASTTDFERLLRSDRTILIHNPSPGLEADEIESLDSYEGTPDGTPDRKRSMSSTSRVVPSTPIVVPPTPRPVRPPAAADEDADVDVLAALADEEEDAAQAKRRSIFRSPGTASSPDLQTLLRKAREKGGVIESDESNSGVGGGNGISPNNNPSVTIVSTPSTSSSGTRPRSQTNRNPTHLTVSTSEANIGGRLGAIKSATLSRDKGRSMGSMTTSSSSNLAVEWNAQREGSTKSSKSTAASSMRAKTTNFFGKLMGSSRQRTPAPPAPPVPALPPQFSTPPRPSTSAQPQPPPQVLSISPRPSTSSSTPHLPASVSSTPHTPTPKQRRPSTADTPPTILATAGPRMSSASRASRPSTSSERSVERHLLQSPLSSPSPRKSGDGGPVAGAGRKRSGEGRRRSMSVSDLDWQSFLRETELAPIYAAPFTAGGLVLQPTTSQTVPAAVPPPTASQTAPSLTINTAASRQTTSPEPGTSVPSTARTFVTAPDGGSAVGSEEGGRNSLGERRKGKGLQIVTDRERGSGETGRSSWGSQRRESGGKAQALTVEGEKEAVETPTSVESGTTMTTLTADGGTSGTTPTPTAGDAERGEKGPPDLPPKPTRVPPRAPAPVRTSSAPTTATIGGGSLPTAGMQSMNESTPNLVRPSTGSAPAHTLSPPQPTTTKSPSPSFLLSPSSPAPAGPSAYAHAAHHRSASASAPSLAIYPSNGGLSIDTGGGFPVGAEGMESRAKELARKCWVEEEGWIGRQGIAEWLGGVGAINKLALRHYMEFFDFSDLRLDVAFRRLCAKLYLKAETQQLDRILERFSVRYWVCNPGTIYGGAGVVHAIAYSLLLLNTDLHIAELSSHMSRTQFVRNTLDTVYAQIRPSPSAASTSIDLPRAGGAAGGVSCADDDSEKEKERPGRNRSGSFTSWKNLQRSDTAPQLAMAGTSAPAGSGMMPGHMSSASVSVPLLRKSESEVSVGEVNLGGKAWEGDMETLLKDMYNAVKSQQILQPLTNLSVSSTNLSPGTPHSVMRRASVRTPSSLKRGSIRGLHQLLSAGGGGQSPYSVGSASSSSIDGRLSPTPSFAFSETNFGSGSTLFTPTLGFASNLSHTIIKESLEDDNRSNASLNTQSTTDDITDEELALFGPPWAKEGMLCRKQYWESTGKRAKNKDWKDVFVVIQKGELDMFVFGEGSNVQASSGVGGGNWLSNAQQVGNVTLSHSLAHVLPPPGYNRARPHCFVLTLSSGAVYFFQAGTEDLVNEWVSTCNYWAARLSKEPLQGGVSNMEYGWNRVLPSSAVYGQDNRDTLSIKSSSISMRLGNSPYSDRTLVAEWKPPMAPSIHSPLDEESQLESLQKHVRTLQVDLDAHTKLKEPMMQLYQPRSASYAKAIGNWERKSQYLLSEVVKYTSYVESLRNAMSLRLKKQGEKAMERALGKSSTAIVELVSPYASGSARKGSVPPETIQEVPEPTTPAKAEFSHKKESAEAGP